MDKPNTRFIPYTSPSWSSHSLRFIIAGIVIVIISITIASITDTIVITVTSIISVSDHYHLMIIMSISTPARTAVGSVFTATVGGGGGGDVEGGASGRGGVRG